jgi:DNA mismatch repair protein MutL
MRTSIIHVLDETTANKIAAGEVVERPASVIKELVENALDAHSSRIDVEIGEGGLDYIRVTDDGVGMIPEDARLAVLRHATSKIKKAEDLHQIGTLGFRGEALPSIASVSKFSLTTRPKEEPLATYLEIHGGNLLETREAGAGLGTTIIVRDLFFNTPARRKFLKKTTTESGYVHAILGKLSLAYPNVAFKLINNGRQVLSTPGNGRLLDTMACLYGHKLLEEVLNVDYQNDLVTLQGYVAKPTFLKSSRQWQTIIVNSRVVNSRIIAKALDSAYHSLLPKSGYPLAVISLHIPLESVDVNVHPQKNEVKFSDEQIIYRAVFKAVSEAIKKPDSLLQAATAINSETLSASKPDMTLPIFNQIPIQPRPMLWQETSVPFSIAKAELTRVDTPPAVSAIPLSCPANEVSVLQPLGQIGDCYLIAAGNDGLYIVDQHAAHERILYDRLAAATDRIPVQQLLVPVFWDFDNQETALIEQHSDIFYSLGVSIDIVGPTTIRVTELPADISLSEAEPLIRDCLRIIQDTKNPSPHTLRHKFLQMAACRSAIKAGDSLNMRQIQALLDELCATELPYTCPHGRPAIVKFNFVELQKMFKRI